MVDQPGGDYWVLWERYVRDVLLARHLISPADMSLFKVTDSVDAAVAEVLGFYRVYHSMRYVHRDLVLRLNRRLPDALPAGNSARFFARRTSGKRPGFLNSPATGRFPQTLATAWLAPGSRRPDPICTRTRSFLSSILDAPPDGA